jgi:hypothetical protein
MREAKIMQIFERTNQIQLLVISRGLARQTRAVDPMAPRTCVQVRYRTPPAHGHAAEVDLQDRLGGCLRWAPLV